MLIASLCAGLIAWRLSGPGPIPPPPAVTGPAKPTGASVCRPKISTIIDSAGDPVLVRRGPVTAPKKLLIAVPARVSQDVPKAKTDAYFVNSALVSTTGGYLGKFRETGQDADALAMQLAVNSDQATSAQIQGQIEAGTDDDSIGADPCAYLQNTPLTSANSNQLEAHAGGAQGKPQLLETILRMQVAGKISDLLITNGYTEESARMMESAAKESAHHIDTLPPQSIGLAVGERDVTGEYRIKQLAIFENGEYVGTIAAKDDGEYDEAAEPVKPPGLLDDSGGAVDAATRFTLADGIYSAGLRNGLPEGVIREAIQLVGRLADLGSPLEAEQSMRILYELDYRDKAKSSGRVVYFSLHGGAVAIDCYSFEGGDGYFRCFDPKAGSESKSGEPRARSAPPSLGSSGAASVGGILAPIRGAPVTSLYGMRFHPILHILRMHAGIDFGAPVGSEVRAAADGVVEFAGPAPGFGNHVRIRHAGFETSYSHLSEIPESIKPGAAVKQGDIVALSGNTGLSTGPHLHFEFYLNGDAVDPLPHLGAEIQSAAATLDGVFVPAAAASAQPSVVSAAEIASFPAVKAYIDDMLAHLPD